MTTDQSRDDLLALCGIEDVMFADKMHLDRILSDHNAVLQNLWSEIPQWWTTDTTGGILRGPTSVTGISVTEGNPVFLATPALEPWMVGCTIRLDGDPFDNEIASATQLARPYMGGTGTVGGTVFGDCLELATNLCGVIPPVILLGERELIGVKSKRDLRQFSAGQSSYGDNTGFGSLTSENKEIGTPAVYLVENSNSFDSNPFRLRVSPLPAQKFAVQFEGKKVAPRVSTLDNATTIPVPHEYAEGIFMPLLRIQFSTWKHFNSQGIRQTLQRQAEEAMELLKRLKPQPVHAGFVRVRPNW